MQLDEFVAWDALEGALSRGEYNSRAEFREAVGLVFTENDQEMTWRNYRAVIDGMFPEYREMLQELPGVVRKVPVERASGPLALVKPRRTRAEKVVDPNRPKNRSKARLTWEIVREIRRDFRTTDKRRGFTSRTAREYGVSRVTISDIINNVTWIEEAA